MYYIMSEENHQILDTTDSIDDEKLQRFANDYKCAVYVLRGEHYGMSCEPENAKLNIGPVGHGQFCNCFACESYSA